MESLMESHRFGLVRGPWAPPPRGLSDEPPTGLGCSTTYFYWHRAGVVKTIFFETHNGKNGVQTSGVVLLYEVF